LNVENPATGQGSGAASLFSCYLLRGFSSRSRGRVHRRRTVQMERLHDALKLLKALEDAVIDGIRGEGCNDLKRKNCPR
jgi:hypothetical protein